MSVPSVCPRCNNTANNGNRLITEICGHTKCKNCLLLEETGCSQCLNCDGVSEQQSGQIKGNVQTESLNILENITIERESEETQKRSKLRQFPEHLKREITDGVTVYTCTICNKTFKSRSQQYYHLFCNNAVNKPYKCLECVQTFASSYHLNYHQEEHKGQSLQCELCPKVFSKLSILKKHQKLHSRSASSCKLCGAQFKDACAFKAHMDKHSDVYNFTCLVCNKKFALKSTYLQHQRSHENSSKNIECEICHVKFRRKSSLKAHLSKHTRTGTEQYFKCGDCFKLFTDKKSLGRHKLVHNGKVIFKCMLCDVTTIRKDNLTRHIRNIHGSGLAENNIELIEKNEEELNQPPPPEPEPTIVEEVQKTEVCRVSVIQSTGKEKLSTASTTTEPSYTSVPPKKKIKKKFDPFDIYRQILDVNDDDEVGGGTDSAKDCDAKETVDNKPIESVALNQSNFTETHWRKNFKYTYYTELK